MTGNAKGRTLHARTAWTTGLLLGLVWTSQAAAAGDWVLISQTELPVKIDEPGNYVMSGNVVVPDADITAIEINADNVTIDMAGFSIRGPASCSRPPVICALKGAGNGIHAVGHDNISILNGRIGGMGNIGIYLEGSANHIERVHVSDNAAAGVLAFGATISGSIVERNGGDGIVGIDVSLQESLARDNQHAGFKGYGSSSYSTSIFSGNNGDGLQVDLHARQGNGNLCNATACP